MLTGFYHNPMHDFKHCPLCASGLQVTLLQTEGRDRLVCTGCGYVHYINPRIVCGTLPIQDGGVWLLRRGIEPRLGYWSYPAGFQELDETTEEAAIRETREEIGVEAEITALQGVYSRPHAPVVNIVYTARLVSTCETPTTTPEAVEVRLCRPEQIPWDDLAFESTYRVLKDWVTQQGGLAR